ncbi:hypothetical protein Q5P01_008129 [Channa striata]|uniref:Serine/threonine-protein kinase PINK1, mitochondrial n=1 Tax=Channa striata TaxID=64152 RepID=A0AA88N646_CHASR|nr:hypothetical protein Q5P01_008129 [Channa striata]
MSVKHAISRGLEFGRSVLQLGLLKPGGRVAAKLRADRLRVGPSVRTVQPRPFLPSRYRYYRTSLRGLAAQLQSAGFRRGFTGGSPRNRAVFLAFGLGVGLVEQQLEEDRKTAATCEEIQAVFRKKRFQSPLKPFPSVITWTITSLGTRLGKAPMQLYAVEHWGRLIERGHLRSMSQELVPAGLLAVKRENEQITLDGDFGILPRRVSAHPNVIRVYRAFTADVPLLPGAQEEYPDVLPARLNPLGLGNNRTLFLVMKNYACTLRQYLDVTSPRCRQGCLMMLQLLEGVDHLCRQGVAHRDLKSDNVLLEFDSDGCPRLVITDFGCCLAQSDSSLQLPYNTRWVYKGGNSSLMAPEVITAVPGRAVVIDYSKADAWAVGAIAYEIFGEDNPFYRALVIRLLLRREPSKRPSARVAANMLHLSLWGQKALASQDSAGMKKLADWLLCQSAVVLLKGCRGPSGNRVEAQLQRSFLSNLDLEDLRTAVGFLLYGNELRQACILSA